MLKLLRSTDVGALVRDRRRVLGLSQAKLAKRLGTSQDWVSRLENGKTTLQVGLVLRALHELGVTLMAKTRDAPRPKARSRNLGKRPRISINDIVDG